MEQKSNCCDARPIFGEVGKDGLGVCYECGEGAIFEDCLPCSTQRKGCEHDDESLMLKAKSKAIRNKVKSINEDLDLIWKGFPHDKLIYKQNLIEMLRNIKTNAEIVIQMLEEMEHDMVSFNTKGVRNDK